MLTSFDFIPVQETYSKYVRHPYLIETRRVYNFLREEAHYVGQRHLSWIDAFVDCDLAWERKDWDEFIRLVRMLGYGMRY